MGRAWRGGGGRIGLAPLGKLGRGKQPHTQGSVLTVGGQGKARSFGGPQDEGNVAASVRVGQDGVEPGHAVRAAALRTPVCVSHGGKEGWVLQSGIWGWIREGTAVGDGLGCWWGQGLGPHSGTKAPLLSGT